MTPRTDNLLIGIDGGGTGCRVAIETRQGLRLGTAKGGEALCLTSGWGRITRIFCRRNLPKPDDPQGIGAGRGLGAGQIV